MELLHDLDAECFRGSGGGRHKIPSPLPPILSGQVPGDLLAGAWQAPVVAVADDLDATPGTVVPLSTHPSSPAAAAACHVDE